MPLLFHQLSVIRYVSTSFHLLYVSLVLNTVVILNMAIEINKYSPLFFLWRSYGPQLGCWGYIFPVPLVSSPAIATVLPLWGGRDAGGICCDVSWCLWFLLPTTSQSKGISYRYGVHGRETEILIYFLWSPRQLYCFSFPHKGEHPIFVMETIILFHIS